MYVSQNMHVTACNMHVTCVLFCIGRPHAPHLCPENASGKLLFMHGSEAQMNNVHFVCIWTDFTRDSKRVFL